MKHHPHRPDWIYVLLAGAISLGIILAAFTAAAAITPEQYDTLMAPWREVIGND